MSDQPKYPTEKFMTPRGVFVFPHLNKPDTKFNPLGEYRVKLRLEPEAAEAFTTKLLKLRDKFAQMKREELTADGKAAKAKKLKLADPVRSEVNKDEEETGFVVVTIKLKAKVERKDKTSFEQKPQIFDAKNKELEKPPVIYGGTEGKVAGEAIPYYNAKDNEVGVTLRLKAAQILKLITGGGPRAATDYGFEEDDDGFEGDDAPASSPFGKGSSSESDDDSADDKDSDDDEDF